MWKRRHFLLTLPLRLQPSSLSPICNEWISAPRFLHEASQLLKNIFHRWRVSRSSRRIRSCSVGPLIRFASHTSIFSHSLTANSATSTETCLIKRPEIEWGKKSLPAYCSRIERRLMSRGEDCHLIWFSHDIYDDIASTTSVAWSAAALQLSRKKTCHSSPTKHSISLLSLLCLPLLTQHHRRSSLVSLIPFSATTYDSDRTCSGRRFALKIMTSMLCSPISSTRSQGRVENTCQFCSCCRHRQCCFWISVRFR